MQPPSALEQLLTTLESYNLAIWPMQVLAYLVGLVAIYSALKTTSYSNSVASGILSFLWIWTGIVFCIFYWGPIYPLGYPFGAFFIVQGLLFLTMAIRPRISFRIELNTHSIIGVLFVVYAMFGYPIVGHFLGHIYPRALPFGLAPCPTAVFTVGLLMMTDKRVPRYILAIPTFWTLSGIVPVSMGVLEDIGLVAAGLICTPMILLRDRASFGTSPSPQH